MPHQVPPLGADGQHQPQRAAALPEAAPMQLALDLARAAAASGEVPVGAVVTASDGAILASSGNRMISDRDASAHAELITMRMAAKQFGEGRLAGCDLWVSLEPCAMCAAAAGLFRIRRVIFGAYDIKGGGVEHGSRVFATSPNTHRPEIVGGVRERESATLLSDFFKERR